MTVVGDAEIDLRNSTLARALLTRHAILNRFPILEQRWTESTARTTGADVQWIGRRLVD